MGNRSQEPRHRDCRRAPRQLRREHLDPGGHDACRARDRAAGAPMKIGRPTGLSEVTLPTAMSE
jgi:hypothetical protein